MKKYILALGLLPFIVACSGSKKAANQPIPANEVEVVIPCSGPDFFTNKKYFFRLNQIIKLRTIAKE